MLAKCTPLSLRGVRVCLWILLRPLFPPLFMWQWGEVTCNGPPHKGAQVIVLAVELPRRSTPLGAKMTQGSLIPPRSKSKKRMTKATCPWGKGVSFFFVEGVISILSFTVFQEGESSGWKCNLLSSVADDMCSANYLPLCLTFPMPGFVVHPS